MSTPVKSPAKSSVPAPAAQKPGKQAKPVTATSASFPAKPQTKKTKPGKAVSAGASPATPKPKEKKVKLVRDSFTIPKDEYEQIAALKLILAKEGRPAKKSELLRAGLMLLGKQSPGALLACVQALAPVKTGRPRKT
jgi:hypothetical protein